MCASSRTPRKSLLLDVPIAGRCAWISIGQGRISGSGQGWVVNDYGDARDLDIEVPVGAFAAILLEPGVSITHEAVRRCVDSKTRLIWVGEEAARLYAVGDGHHVPERLLSQARVVNDRRLRIEAARRLYLRMFEEEPPPSYSIEKLRGIEGAKVRQWYEAATRELNLPWSGKGAADDVNRVIGWTNACLYACAEVAICILGFSPSLGVVHAGDPRSFAFDVADAVKFRLVLRPALEWYAKSGSSNFQEVRRFCREHFHQIRLLDELIKIASEVLDADGGSMREIEPC